MYNLGDKADNTAGDTGSLPAAQFNDFKNESEHLITSTGQTLTTGVGDDTYQMAKAAAVYAARGDFLTASGTANAITVAAVGSMQLPPTFVTGMRVRLIPPANCSGASTLTYGALGAKAIRNIDDTATTTGSYTTLPLELMYISTFNSSAGGWAIIDNGAGSGGGVSNPVTIGQGGTGQTTAYEGLDALTVQGANIASASTTNLASATGISVTVTGSATINSFGTANAGVLRVVRFSSTATLTNSAAIICLGGANITTAANDIAVFRSEGSGNWRMVSYSAAANSPQATGVTKATTSAVSYTADGATYTMAHGLGSKPFMYNVIAKCTSADHNFSVNDEVQLSSSGDNGSGGAADVGCNLRADATNVYVDVGVDGIYVFDKTAFTVQKMTTTKWDFFAVAII